MYKSIKRLEASGRVVVQEVEDEGGTDRKMVFRDNAARDEYLQARRAARGLEGGAPPFFRTLHELFDTVAHRDDRRMRELAGENGVSLEGVMGFLVDVLTEVMGEDLDDLEEEQKRAEAYLGEGE